MDLKNAMQSFKSIGGFYNINDLPGTELSFTDGHSKLKITEVQRIKKLLISLEIFKCKESIWTIS